MSDSDPQEPEETPAPQTCCPLRRKVVVGVLGVLPEDKCGVSDSELADVLRFDLAAPSGKPVIAFRFCPWCGEARAADGETRIVDATGPGDADPGDSGDPE